MMLVNINMIDFNAFSHGQIQSKLWLCEQLEPHLPDPAQVMIIGSWYNLLGFMMLTRKSDVYNMIQGVDVDDRATQIADKVNNAWMIGEGHKLRNITKHIDTISHKELGYNNVIINTSCEHMDATWYHKVNPYQLVCIQSSNVVNDDPVWNITHPIPDMQDFKSKFPMGQILFEGEKVFDYGHLKYNRMMLIGRL